ncbi:MAG TPA: hypothetical protein VFW97_03685 [Acidimicrobiia bacterium]|jgi:hypothetical protein|nr:hypothetical protein [Acidimicrobiia bacterium]
MMLVDAANVIGSRPTGWWRDRAGAARRFADAVRECVRDGRIESPVVGSPSRRVNSENREAAAGGPSLAL